jgi:hypothetical protein
MKMNRYAIFQLSDDSSSFRDLYFMNTKQIEKISDEYEFVARIDARNLNEVFRIGNFVVEEDETLRDVRVEGMRSISVGDIVQNIDDDKCFVCLRNGWEEINMKECV